MEIKSGIILAGGFGTRLRPQTNLYNKHLLPIHDRFIIDYPLDTLKQMGVINLTVVLGGPHFSQIVSHIKDGNHLGMQVNYIYQDQPIGIAQAINLCERFVSQDDHFAVVLGDNIFENPIKLNKNCSTGAQIVLSDHPELERFGVASIKNAKIVKIEEKPKVIDPAYHNYAITGCYIFDRQFFRYFAGLQPSARGEYEITDVINCYSEDNDLGYSFSEGLWSDAGTHSSINKINNFFYQKEQENK